MKKKIENNIDQKEIKTVLFVCFVILLFELWYCKVCQQSDY